MNCFVLAFVLLPLAAADLERVVALFRHGERTPANSYPNDPHKDFKYNGLEIGDLTQRGNTQLFNLGSTLHKDYLSLFNKELTSINLLAKSSNFTRTINSGKSFLTGFYPNSINWVPDPLQVIPSKDDYQIATFNCPREWQLFNSTLENPPNDVLQIRSDLTPVIEAFWQNSGFRKIGDFEMHAISDTIESQQRWGLAPPDWFKPEFRAPLRRHLPRFFAMFTETDEMKKLVAGALITEILDQMIPTESNPIRALLYSGHDITVTHLARLLAIENQLPAIHDFGASIVLALHRTHLMFEVQIKYYERREDDTFVRRNVKIPNCEEPCSYHKLKKNLEFLINRDPKQLCEL